MTIKIGLQLYSIREKCEENLENVLKAVANAGYDGVQFYSFFDIEANKMKQLLSKYNLESMGTHTNADMLQNDLDGLMKYNSTIGSEYISLAYYESGDKDGWLRLSDMLDKAGEKLKSNGFKLLYHNHAHEFEPKYGGEVAESIILNNTSPENVSLELDCYWVTYAGLNPEEYLTQNLSRIKTIHVKDMAKQDKKMTEVGTGIIDYAKLIPICRKAGFNWVNVEQDNIYMDPFESIKISVGNLRKY